MKIRITVDDDEKATVSHNDVVTDALGSEGAVAGPAAASPPADLVRRGQAVGAISAGPAPTGPLPEGTPAFLPTAPSTPAASLLAADGGAGTDMSGGGAPQFMADHGQDNSADDDEQADA